MFGFSKKTVNEKTSSSLGVAPEKHIGLIAGNSSYPLRFAEDAKRQGYAITAVCHRGETPEAIEAIADKVIWIKVGELGKIIRSFQEAGVQQAVMAGGINRIRLFGGVKLDARGVALLARLKSAKDDIIMRGIADELESEGIQIKPCTMFCPECLVSEGILTRSEPTAEEREDITIGIEAIKAMTGQHIGQVVVVREGVIVAVEAVEGTDRTILRGGELGGKGTVVVKCAKPDQDMRFDVPTVGLKTVETMISAKVRVLALEAGRSMIIDEEEVFALANKHKISIVGVPGLV